MKKAFKNKSPSRSVSVRDIKMCLSAHCRTEVRPTYICFLLSSSEKGRFIVGKVGLDLFFFFATISG